MELQILGASTRYSRARLVEPPANGYIHLAAVVEPSTGPAPLPRSSAAKVRLLDRLKALGQELERVDTVDKVTVYKAVLAPPPIGYAKQHHVHHARYDVVVLVETTTPETIGDVQRTEPYQHLHDALAEAASDVHVMAARCAKSLGDVDKTRPGLFIFNYFVAEDAGVALELVDYLAGWYAVQTGLDNSTVLQPIDKADYAFVNHARWDYGLPRLMLHQFTKPSFRTYVLSNLLVNRTGAMPVFYHLA
jgi:hypothetical protein